MGLCLYNIAFIFSFENLYPENSEIECIVEIIDLKKEKNYENKYIIKIVEMHKVLTNKKYSKFKNTKIILYTKKEFNYAPGDIVFIKGNFEKAEKSRNYKGYNYRNYLKQEKIYGIINSDKAEKIDNIKDRFYILGKIKISIYNKLEKLYKNEYSEFLKGILFGDIENLEENIKENFRKSSISHILAISGMHITYVILGLEMLLEKIIKNKKVRNYILIIVLFIFLIFTGTSVSCIRAFFMITMKIISFNLNRKNNFYLNMFFSFIIIIFINPFNIFNIGMWLSYLGTIGIVIFSNFFNKFFNNKFKLKNNTIFKYMSTCISAQILIFPVIIYCFNTISLTFLISNILISFFIGFIIVLGYISIFVCYIFPTISYILVIMENTLIFIIFKISEFCSNLFFSQIYLITPNIIIVIFYYIFIYYIIKIFKNNKFYFLKVILSKKYFKIFIYNIYINLKNRIIYFVYKLKNKKIIILFLIIILLFFIIKLNQNLKIYFIDVGQGDSTLIITPKGKNILIDGGEGNSEKYDIGKKVLLPYLLDRGIIKIDYLIVSHMDSDHVGGLIYIIENLKIGKIFIGIQSESSYQLEELLKIAQNKNIEVVVLKSGMKIDIEKDIYINILWPDANNLINENKLNNNSLVFKFVYKNFSLLFTGDIEEIAEKEILKKYENNLKILSSNILKVAHHGSKTSSSLEFLEKIKPQIALIGVGKENNFGHPNKEILERLKNMNINIYRTDVSGEIEIKINKLKLKIHTKY